MPAPAHPDVGLQERVRAAEAGFGPAVLAAQEIRQSRFHEGVSTHFRPPGALLGDLIAFQGQLERGVEIEEFQMQAPDRIRHPGDPVPVHRRSGIVVELLIPLHGLVIRALGRGGIAEEKEGHAGQKSRMRLLGQGGALLERRPPPRKRALPLQHPPEGHQGLRQQLGVLGLAGEVHGLLGIRHRLPELSIAARADPDLARETDRLERPIVQRTRHRQGVRNRIDGGRRAKAMRVRVHGTEPQQDLNLAPLVPDLLHQGQRPLVCGHGLVIGREHHEDGPMLGMEAGDQPRLGGWGTLGRGVHRPGVMRRRLRVGIGLCSAIPGQGAIRHGFGPALARQEVMGHFRRMFG